MPRTLSLLALVAILCACSRSPLGLPREVDCIAVDGVQSFEVSTRASVDRADIFFLIDNSGSMVQEIRQIQEQVERVLVPGIRGRVRDPAFGVGVFSDFGEQELGKPFPPFLLLQPITDQVERVAQALTRIEIEVGGDEPESQLEALYQVATGEGLGVFVDEGPPCPPGSYGGVCFRDGSLPLIMLFTDAPMRNLIVNARGEPVTGQEFDPFGPDAPFIPYLRTFPEVQGALLERGIHVVGLWSGNVRGRDDLELVVRESGGVDSAGNPVVFDIGDDGGGLGAGVVDSVDIVTNSVSESVTANVVHADERRTLPQGAFELTPLRSNPQSAAVINRAARRFDDVEPGTELTFLLTVDTRQLPATQSGPLAVEIHFESGTGAILEVVPAVFVLSDDPAACD